MEAGTGLGLKLNQARRRLGEARGENRVGAGGWVYSAPLPHLRRCGQVPSADVDGHRGGEAREAECSQREVLRGRGCCGRMMWLVGI